MAKKKTDGGDVIELEPDVQANGDQPARAKESKRQRFERLARYRVNRALDSIRKLESLGNRAIYDFHELDQQKIVDALSGAVAKVGAALEPRSSGNQQWSL